MELVGVGGSFQTYYFITHTCSSSSSNSPPSGNLERIHHQLPQQTKIIHLHYPCELSQSSLFNFRRNPKHQHTTEGNKFFYSCVASFLLSVRVSRLMAPIYIIEASFTLEWTTHIHRPCVTIRKLRVFHKSILKRQWRDSCQINCEMKNASEFGWYRSWWMK